MNDQVLGSSGRAYRRSFGGELQGIINSLISDASIRDDGLITPELIQTVAGYAMHKHEFFTQGFAPQVST